MTSEDTFYNYRSYRWMWFALIVLITMVAVYIMDNPIGGKSGGTVVGYTYGIIGAAGILWLMLFGIRKRSYASRMGTLEGWLSAHVWLGIALLVVVPLHSAFQFGLNVHTLAYVLMVLTILSGIWGALNYATLARSIESHRGGGSTSFLVEEIEVLSAEIDKLCAQRSDVFLGAARSLDIKYEPSFGKLLGIGNPRPIDRGQIGTVLSKLPPEEAPDGLKLVGLIDQKLDLTIKAFSDARKKALLKLWLYCHLPLSFGLLAALGVHIMSVFYNW